MKQSLQLTLAAAGGAVIVVVLLALQLWRESWPFAPPTRDRNVIMAPATDLHQEHRAADARTSISLAESHMDGLGIRVEPVRRESVARLVRAVATVVPDEARLSHVHTRVSGWIERLHVNTTGQSVRAGQPLAEIFSQELLASQNEYLAARNALSQGGSEAIARGARARLTVLGMVEAEIASLERSGQAKRLVTVAAPRSGVVLRRAISVGTAVDPSTEIVTIADLSSVWILAELPEREATALREGMPATLAVPASGLEPFESTLSFVYPTLTERTRTLRVRFVVPNPEGRLRPGMYATATFGTEPRDALTIPRDAVVDTGLKQHVFVSSERGRFDPREVSLGVAVEDRLEVRAGLEEGEQVVAAGVFLIDSESRLRGSTGGPDHAAH